MVNRLWRFYRQRLEGEAILDSALSWSRGFAGRVLRDAGPEPQGQLERAWRLACSRPLTPGAKDVALTYFNRHQRNLARRVAAAEEVALPAGLAAGADRAKAATFLDFCHMLRNSNEFVCRNWRADSARRFPDWK